MTGAAYAAEAAALDARILAAIAAYALDDGAFDDLACDVFAHQFRWNAPYAAYARSRGVHDDALPRRAVDIPAVPAAAFKDAVLSTVPPERAAQWFETSGTTQARSGRHYLETPRLYDAALLAGFDRALLADGVPLRYLQLVPDPRERPHSSLGHMMATVARERGDGRDGWFLHADDLDVDGFRAAIASAHADRIAVCIATTAFALVALLDALAASCAGLPLPPRSRVMETGGFKGRTRVVAREELYARAAAAFAIDPSAIVAEYGMTELSSQYYDAAATRSAERRIKEPVPWLRPIVVDPAGTPLPAGIVGSIRHIDCANRSSVVAIDTEDLGVLAPHGLILLGREEGAALRGCSLDAEALRRTALRALGGTRIVAGARRRGGTLVRCRLSTARASDGGDLRPARLHDPRRRVRARPALWRNHGPGHVRGDRKRTRRARGARRRRLARRPARSVGARRRPRYDRLERRDDRRRHPAARLRSVREVHGDGQRPQRRAGHRVRRNARRGMSRTSHAAVDARSWTGGDDPGEARALGEADVVVAFGGPEALLAIRGACAPDATFVPFGHRASAGYYRGNDDVAADIDTIAAGAARDALLYDGEGCLSLHVIFVEGDDATLDAFAAALTGACCAAAIEFPPGTRERTPRGDRSAVHGARGVSRSQRAGARRSR